MKYILLLLALSFSVLADEEIEPTLAYDIADDKWAVIEPVTEDTAVIIDQQGNTEIGVVMDSDDPDQIWVINEQAELEIYIKEK